MRNPVGAAAVLVLLALAARAGENAPELPATADGWRIERVAQTAKSFAPSTVAAGPEESVYLGQNPTAPTRGPNASVLRLSQGTATVFIDELESVSGMTRVGDVLHVVHPPFVSAFRDMDGDGRAEERVDLVSGLAASSGNVGSDDRAAGDIRRGMDGFLYVAIGDKGIDRGVGKDGATIRMRGGGVIRVRPDGSGLEVVSTGDCRTTGLVLSAADDVFTLGGGGAGGRWSKSLVHQISGADYGYPRHFATAAFRALPVMSKLGDGGAGRGDAYNEAGLPEEYRGNLFLCDPDEQTVYRCEVRKAGGSFALAKRIPFVTKGNAANFRPVAIVARDDGLGFWLAEEGGGRLYRLSLEGADDGSTTPHPLEENTDAWIEALDHPARSVRLEAQDRLANLGAPAVGPLVDRLRGAEPVVGRVHALWALDQLETAEARGAIRSVLRDPAPQVRLQAARSRGIRRDGEAREELVHLLVDRDPAVRREASVALGRIGDHAAVPALLEALGEADSFAAWSIRWAIREIGCDDAAALVAALEDPRRREAALILADESWSIPIVEALVEALAKTPEPAVRGRILSCLAGQYRRYPEWSGEWFGPDPLSGPSPKKTEPWAPEGMETVLRGLGIGLNDADATVRYQAIFGLQSVGAPAASALRGALADERDADNRTALVESLGVLNDATSTRLLLPVVVDPEEAEPTRVAALDALNRLRGPDVVRARLTVLYDEKSPDSLVARALPALARDGFLPPNDLADFLKNDSPLVRASAVMSLNPSRPLPPEVKQVVLERLDDEDGDVRRAALLAAGPLKLREAVPTLLEKARTARDEDRAAVLIALCALPDPAAVSFYVAALADPDPSLRRAGVSALVAIRDRAEAEIKRLAGREDLSPDAALALDRVLARFEPIRGWRLLGPLPPGTPGLIARDGSIDGSGRYPGASGAPVAWRLIEPDDASGKVDLSKVFGEDSTPRTTPVDAVAYAEIESATDRRAILLMRATGPFDLFVNGSPVSADPAARDGRDYFEVPLVRGTNRVLVATRRGDANWEFQLLASVAETERGGTNSRPR